MGNPLSRGCPLLVTVHSVPPRGVFMGNLRENPETYLR